MSKPDSRCGLIFVFHDVSCFLHGSALVSLWKGCIVHFAGGSLGATSLPSSPLFNSRHQLNCQDDQAASSLMWETGKPNAINLPFKDGV